MEAIGVEDEAVLDQQLDGVRALRARTPAVGAPPSALFDHGDRLIHHLEFFVALEVARDLVIVAVTFHHMAVGEDCLDRFRKTLGDGPARQECRLDVLFLQNPQQPINGMVRAVFALAPHFIVEDAVLVRLHVLAALEIEGQKHGGPLSTRPTDEMVVMVFLEHGRISHVAARMPAASAGEEAILHGFRWIEQAARVARPATVAITFIQCLRILR